MLRRVVLAALLAANADANASANVSASVDWGDCVLVATRLATNSQFDCATLRAPFCHERAPCDIDATHELQILRRRTNADPSAPTVWLVADSAETRTLADIMERIASTTGKGTVNVYGLQMRLWNPPTGPSGSFHFRPCLTLSEDFGARATIDNSTLDAAAAGRDWVRQNLGENGLLGYSLTNAASDLDIGLRVVQSQELQSNPNLFVMSVGKASRVVQRYMALTADAKTGVAGLIFDTPHPMKFSMNQDEINGAATTLYLSGCESDKVCRAKYGNASTSMGKILDQMYSDVDSSTAFLSDCVKLLKRIAFNDVRDLKPSHGLRRFFASWRKDTEKATLVAPVLYRAHRCATNDYSTLQTVMDVVTGARRLQLSTSQISQITRFIERVIAYSEIWPQTVMSRDELIKAFERSTIVEGALLLQHPSACLYRASNSSECRALYRRTPEVNSTIALTYSAPSVANSSSINAMTGLIALKSPDVLIVTSRLSTDGSAEVSRQLYDEFMSKGGSGRTITLIESNNLASNEVDGGSQDTILKLVGRFITKKGNGWDGLRHVDDFSGVDWTSDTITLDKSTYGSALVAVNFKVSSRLRILGAGIDFALDPYDPRSTSSSQNVDDDSSLGATKIAQYVLPGLVVLGIAVGCAVGRRRSTADPSGTPSHNAQPMASHQPPIGFPPQDHGTVPRFGSWVEQPANGYASSYTPSAPSPHRT